ncbi:sensor histidine kinase [Sphaerisporangium corydalis]|uniref:histidine kinase n=1 Tax=Sphaerisporangium corydalis TaxID=1441875 RepID=A0ABV9EQ36_9ACTN|nr:sensor domain-containing protein [Sphaerisporangium corydalis]
MPPLLATARPWRALAYLAGGVPVGVALLTALPPLVLTGLGLVPVAVGIVPLVAAALIGVPLGALERRRMRLVDPRPAPSPHRPPGRPGVRAWLGTRFGEAATWQELAFAILTAVVLWPLDLVVVTSAILLCGSTLFAPAIVALAPDLAMPNGEELARTGLIWAIPPLGVLVTLGMAHVVTEAADIRAALTRAVLVPSPDGDQLVELTRSRSRLVTGFDDERRRIERDLHDGVQQRLLALSVTLSLARMELPEPTPGPDTGPASTEPGAGQGSVGPGSVPSGVPGSAPVGLVDPGSPARLAELVVSAHEESKAILDQLRELVRGIHPWILSDRGLTAAIAELAGRVTVPVRTDVDLPGRFSRTVESTVYFVVSEALSNVDKHSGAAQATVTGRYAGGLLTFDVRDDGRGGADPELGTGLLGLADRASAADARLLVASPPGGPTLLRLEIPCTPIG